jgi:hypothetical protein
VAVITEGRPRTVSDEARVALKECARADPPAPLRQLVDITLRVRTRPLPDITTTSLNMAPGVPKPGPAKLGPRAGLDEWLEQAKLCRYLPEGTMKQLCEMVKECLMEGTFN